MWIHQQASTFLLTSFSRADTLFLLSVYMEYYSTRFRRQYAATDVVLVYPMSNRRMTLQSAET